MDEEKQEKEPIPEPVKYVCWCCCAVNLNGNNSQCKNCGSTLGGPLGREMHLNSRRPFSTDNRRDAPQ